LVAADRVPFCAVYPVPVFLVDYTHFPVFHLQAAKQRGAFAGRWRFSRCHLTAFLFLNKSKNDAG
jgi:hypothetical protein